MKNQQQHLLRLVYYLFCIFNCCQIEQITHFDVQDVMIDTFYYFDQSTKRKNSLADYSVFCDVQVRKLLKQVNTRWLSLEKTVCRTLQQYPALKSYFLSEGN